MARGPGNGDGLEIAGNFDFYAQSVGGPSITERFLLRIVIPRDFPKTLPVVYEKGGRIPPTGSFHVNSDGSLCLGSPLRLRWMLSKAPTLVSFAELCVVPCLYAVGLRLAQGGQFIFGELAHGRRGEFDDYVELLQLQSLRDARTAIVYLSRKKRCANKKPCPCGCGLRLGLCRFNSRLREFRALAPRSWYRELLT